MSYPSNPTVHPPTSINAFGRANINNPISNIPGTAKDFTYSRVAILSGTIGATTSGTLIAAVSGAQIVVWGVEMSNGTGASDVRTLFYSDVVSDNQTIAILSTHGTVWANSDIDFGGQPVCIPANTALQYSIATAAGGQTNMMVFYSVVMSPSA